MVAAKLLMKAHMNKKSVTQAKLVQFMIEIRFTMHSTLMCMAMGSEFQVKSLQLMVQVKFKNLLSLVTEVAKKLRNMLKIQMECSRKEKPAKYTKATEQKDCFNMEFRLSVLAAERHRGCTQWHAVLVQVASPVL